MNNPLDMWDGIGGIFVMMACLVLGVVLLVALIFALHFLVKGAEWCYGRCRDRWRKRNKPRRPLAPNPWENAGPVPPPAPAPPAPPPPPAPARRASRPKKPRYVQQDADFTNRVELGPRSPVRLLYSAAFERLSCAELEEIRVKAPGVIERLHRAAFLLSKSQTREAENLLFVLRGYIRGYFGEGRFWLEAVITADIAALCHHANKPDDAQYFFDAAERIAEPWFARYPWLKNMVTRRRLIKL